MQNSSLITLYHLSRRDGTAVFLHPFVKKGSLLEVAQSTNLGGKYGREPRVESATMLRNDLYRRIEEDVRDWINERRFIPRFLIAAAAFMVVYLFLAAVVRDPLPIVDEVLISLGVGIATFVIVGRRFEQSKAAAQRRVQLRAKVDAVVFSEDQFVHALEDLFQQLEESAAVKLPDAEQTGTAPEASLVRLLWQEHSDDTARVLDYLRTLLSIAPYRDLERSLKRGRLTGKLATQVDHGELSPALVHLFYQLKAGAR